MSVFGSTGSSGAVYNSGFGGTEDLVSGDTVAVDCSVGIAFGGYHPNLLLYFCKWGNSVPINIIPCFVVLLHWGSVVPGPGTLSLLGDFGVVALVVLLVGGIGQFFLNSKRFPDIFPALGHGVPDQTGMFLSGGGLLSEVPSGEGFLIL